MWQFQLRHLFGLTTIAAISAALLASHGPGTLVTSVGLLIAWLSYCGAFEYLQSGRRQVTLICIAWGAFLVSLALPSLEFFGPVLGLWAVWLALSGPFYALSRGEFRESGLLVFLVIDVANVLISALPILLGRLHEKVAKWFASLLCIAMVAPWCVGWNDKMLVGYYVWCASFMLALVAIPIRLRTLIAMVVTAIILGIAGP